MRDLTSSSGLGGGGGSVVLSILRSRAFFFPELVFAFFPMVVDNVENIMWSTSSFRFVFGDFGSVVVLNYLLTYLLTYSYPILFIHTSNPIHMSYRNCYCSYCESLGCKWPLIQVVASLLKILRYQFRAWYLRSVFDVGRHSSGMYTKLLVSRQKT